MWLDKFNEMRKKSGLSLDELAEKSGVPKGTLSKITAGITKNPSIETIRSMVHAMGFTLNDLDDGHGALKKAPSVSDEADDIAVLYRGLDERGKGAVKAILQYEAEPVKNNVITCPKTAKAKKRSDGFIEFHVYDQPAAAGLGNYLDEPDYHIEQYPAEVVPSKADFGIVISGDSMEPKIHDGCTAFVQSAVSIDDGQIGIFRLNGSAYCKKLSIDRKKRQVKLVSLNKKYEDILIGEYDKFDTVGLVTGTYSK